MNVAGHFRIDSGFVFCKTLHMRAYLLCVIHQYMVMLDAIAPTFNDTAPDDQ